MALSNTIKKMEAMLMDLALDLRKASEKGNKAAAQRVRTGTIKFAKLAKEYRKESINAESKQGTKKKAKKTVRRKKVAKKSAAKSTAKRKAPARKKKATKKTKHR